MGEGNTDNGSMDRRTALKAGVAVGVGVAAWSIPEITSLGGTPAYAAVCTRPVSTFEVGSRNTACNCNSPTPKAVSYKEFGTACAGAVFPGVVELRSGSCAGALIGPSGECPPSHGGAAGLCVSSVPTGQSCKIVVRVEQGNCGAMLITQVVSGVFNSPSFVFMPTAGCTGNGNVFVRVQIRCSFDPDCLP